MKKLALAWPLLFLFLAALLPAAPADAPRPLKPVNLAVNTRADEDDPFLASRGLTLYYASNAKGKWDIMVAHRDSVRKSWPAGDVLQDYIATEADDRGVWVTAEDRYPQYMYFASKQDKGNNNFDIYVAVKQGPTKAFTEPRAVVNVNTTADEMHPWVSADGKQLYFSRKTKEGWRVFVASRRSATGPQGFTEPAPVKELPPGFHHPTLTPDGATMYLQGPLEKERWGLFVAKKSGGTWDQPIPLEQLNHPDGPTGDRSPCLSRDGAMLYFASDRPGGKGGLDLYVIRTAELKVKR
jgi:Tol biopolymer transport system component